MRIIIATILSANAFLHTSFAFTNSLTIPESFYENFWTLTNSSSGGVGGLTVDTNGLTANLYSPFIADSINQSHLEITAVYANALSASQNWNINIKAKMDLENANYDWTNLNISLIKIEPDYKNRGGIGIVRGKFNDTWPNSATRISSGLISNGEESLPWYHTNAGNSWYDLKIEYNANSKSLLTQFKNSQETSFSSLGPSGGYDLAAQWGLNSNDDLMVILGFWAYPLEGRDVNVSGGQMILKEISIVPEPSALSLLAFGLGGLAMMRRRRS